MTATTPASRLARPPTDASAHRSAVWVSTLVAVVAALGLVLRLIGIRFGLPAVYNPDEVAILSRALAFATGDLNPHNFLYPTGYFYVLFGWIGMYFIAGRGFGFFDSITAFEQQFFTDPSGIYLAARALGALAGTATVLATYVLARRLFGRPAGLVAALFVAIAPLHVRDSHYIKHDVPVTLAVVLAFIALVRLLEDERPARPIGRSVAIAAAACGVAFATHYYSVFLVLPLIYAVVMRGRREGPVATLRGLGRAGAVSAGVFFLLSPFILLEPWTAWRDITANRRIVVDSAVEASAWPFASAGRYADILWADGLGWPVVVLAAVGLAWMLRTNRRQGVLLLLFCVPFLLFISNTVAASRYLNPVLPLLAVMASHAVGRLSRVNGAGRPALVAAIAVVAAVPGLAGSVKNDLFFRQTDTRTLALRYIESHVPAGATILIQPYSTPLTQSHESLKEALEANVGGVERASAKFTLRLALERHAGPTYRTIFLGDGGLDADKIYVTYGQVGGGQGLDALRRLGVQYVVLKRYNRPDPATVPFLSVLEREGRRTAVFSPYGPDVQPATAATVEPFLHNTDARIDDALERPGPVIEIWTLSDTRS